MPSDRTHTTRRLDGGIGSADATRAPHPGRSSNIEMNSVRYKHNKVYTEHSNKIKEPRPTAARPRTTAPAHGHAWAAGPTDHGRTQWEGGRNGGRDGGREGKRKV